MAKNADAAVITTFRPRSANVEAFRVQFDDAGNLVAAPGWSPAPTVGAHGRAVVVTNTDRNIGHVLHAQDGQWIARHEDGSFEVLTDSEFSARFEPAVA